MSETAEEVVHRYFAEWFDNEIADEGTVELLGELRGAGYEIVSTRIAALGRAVESVTSARGNEYRFWEAANTIYELANVERPQ